jgi:hypothetical protein
MDHYSGTVNSPDDFIAGYTPNQLDSPLQT